MYEGGNTSSIQHQLQKGMGWDGNTSPKLISLRTDANLMLILEGKFASVPFKLFFFASLKLNEYPIIGWWEFWQIRIILLYNLIHARKVFSWTIYFLILLNPCFPTLSYRLLLPQNHGILCRSKISLTCTLASLFYVHWIFRRAPSGGYFQCKDTLTHQHKIRRSLRAKIFSWASGA